MFHNSELQPTLRRISSATLFDVPTQMLTGQHVTNPESSLFVQSQASVSYVTAANTKLTMSFKPRRHTVGAKAHSET
jgi:hypothetical protein